MKSVYNFVVKPKGSRYNNVKKVLIYVNKKNRIKTTRGRKVKISGFKKAIVTLKKGQSIDLTTGI